MGSCLSPAQLHDFLAERLNPVDCDAASRHIDRCAACQLALDGLLGEVARSLPAPALLSEREPRTRPLPTMLADIARRPPDPSTASLAVITTEFLPAWREASRTPVDPRAPLSLADFELQQRIGSGGTGAVYRAVQRSLKKAVAIKVHEPTDRPDEIARFVREACSAARLRHPNIVDVHGIGRTPSGGYFLVMDLVSGRNLESHCRAGRLSYERIAEIVATIADAVHYGHEQGVIHRDLKPGNVLIADDGRVLVTDFGIAKVEGDDDLTRRECAVGTPRYMAPEQADSTWGAVGPWTDVYGLGGILYFLLTGQHPHADERGPLAVLARVVSDEPPLRPSEVVAEVPAELERVCLRCTNKRPAERFATARDVAVALRGLSWAAPSAPAIAANVVLLHDRSSAADQAAAERLAANLEQRGLHVFVDRQVTPSVTWARQLDEEIRRADAVIVLLSAASARSELLAQQIQWAEHAAAERAGRPRVISLSLGESGRVPEDSPPSGTSLALADSAAFDDASITALVARIAAPRTVAPAAPRMRRLEPPLGAIPLDSHFYLVRAADAQFASAIERRDSIVLVRGARQMGKTSLVARGLNQARTAGTRVVLTDFQKLNASDLSSAESLFLALGSSLADRLDLDVTPHDTWQPRRGASVNFERFLRREVLAKLSAPLVWGLDEADRIFACPFSSEVFGLFRSWHNERALDPSGPWAMLTLVIAYATEAHLFITDLNQSPFNVGTRLSLEDFSPDQVAELDARYGRPLRGALQRFVEIVGGQPYLVNRGLYEMAANVWDVERFAASARADDGLFGDHLRRMVVLLAQDERLCDAVRGVLTRQTPPSSDAYYRLTSAGILSGPSPQDCRLRCGLYETYLRQRLV